ncbi:MAG: HAD family hydrolase [Proteobacteria bacterium]|nr:HAD family hydrolase [Pseudomonadota bacterium]
MPTPVVTFDAGQTLVELDLDFLSHRLAERAGIAVAPTVLGQAATEGWRVHDRRVAEGAAHPWRELMAALLGAAGISQAQVPELVEWLWSQQPRHNLWRKPIPAMVALARALAADGVRVAVLSNSEGHIRELLEEIAIADPFAAIVDSGVFGIAKPDPRIFAHALARLGVDPTDACCVHVGDSYPADVLGALGAGPAWRAVWFGPRVEPVDDPRVASARDATEVRGAIDRFWAGRTW